MPFSSSFSFMNSSGGSQTGGGFGMSAPRPLANAAPSYRPSPQPTPRQRGPFNPSEYQINFGAQSGRPSAPPQLSQPSPPASAPSAITTQPTRVEPVSDIVRRQPFSARSASSAGEDWLGYLNSHDDLRKEYDAFATRPGGYAFGPNLPASYDANSNSFIDPEEYAQFHWERFGQSEGRSLTGPAPEPSSPSPAQPPQERISAEENEVRERTEQIEQGIAQREQEVDVARQRLRETEQRANAPAEQAPVNSAPAEQTPAPEPINRDDLRAEILREIENDRVREQQLVAEREVRERALAEQRAQEALEAERRAEERERIIRDGDLFFSGAQDVMRRLNSTRNISDPYAEDGFYTIRDERDRLLDQLTNYDAEVFGDEASEVGRFGRAISALQGFDEGFERLQGRRNSALEDIQAQAQEAMSRLEEAPIYDEDVTNNIRTQLSELTADLEDFGFYGTESASEDLQAAMGALRQRREDLSARREEFAERARTLAEQLQDRSFYTNSELDGFSSDAEMQRIEAEQYGAQTALQFFDLLEGRLASEEARLTQDAQVVEERELRERNEFLTAQDSSSNPFAGFEFSNSAIFDDISPEQYLSYLLAQNSERRFIDEEGRGFRLPGLEAMNYMRNSSAGAEADGFATRLAV